MPVVLRSRRSIRASSAAVEGRLPDSATRRRSTRLRGRADRDEDSDESDSESVQIPEMTERYVLAEVEEETAEKAGLTATDLKDCSVLLDRLMDGDKLGQRDLEEKEDMNRKGGKPASRIPTFLKRPSGHSVELQVSKKEISIHGAPPPEKAELGGLEASKFKPPELREMSLVQPSIRLPKLGFEVSSGLSSTEDEAVKTHSFQIAAPKSWSFSESVVMTASPRPALRSEQGPEEDQSSTIDNTCEVLPKIAESFLPPESSRSLGLREDSALRGDATPTDWTTVTASGDDQESAEEVHTDQADQEEDIMDEEPPWETEPMKTADLKDSRSSSDAECEDDLKGEESEDKEEEEVKEHEELLVIQEEISPVGEKVANTEESTSAAAPEKRRKDGSASKSSKRSGCSSLALCFLLPTTLLLLGGLGQHVWHYGLPMSVAQLLAQLELHWLEGLGLAAEPCSSNCRVHLVESIPVGLYPSSPPSRLSIADSWLHLLDRANSSVDIAAFYFTLRSGDVQLAQSSDSQGRKVFEQLKQLGSKGVKLQIAVNSPQQSTLDTAELAEAGAEVSEVNLQALTGGIVHTKLWVVDRKHFYLGSANMDWRSLSEVKEVGVSVEDCSCLAQDAWRIFGVYWSLGGANSSLPPYWPDRYSALSSSHNPLHLKLNGVPAQVYLSSAPPLLSARGRSDDLSTILSVISDAQEFIYISVMDFLPTSEFTKPLRLWPAIDLALRAAACTRPVEVRLLVSCWPHSPPSMFTFLQSLLVLSRAPLHCRLQVKMFTVPSTAEQKKIPYARVNHAKYMVTDRVLYIGTSNWSENYFTHTAGVGLVVNQTGSEVDAEQQTLQSQAEELFLRDWNSPYSSPLSMKDEDVCPGGPH